MKVHSSISAWSACLLLSLALAVSGCKGNQGNQASTGTDQASDQGDPANANVVPISNTTTGAASQSTTSEATPASTASSSAPANTASSSTPASGQSGEYSSDQDSQDNGYGEQPEATAPQPPPELPQYQQPPVPEEGDIWTPGYWAWASPGGYYWVPGAWVRAPYVGALWTPGYWGWRGGRYAFYRGYWGRHIGYYGGINYGFGYVGFGYQGGYWRGNAFAYNSAVNRVDTMVIHNVYNYRITNVEVRRISYNGGNGGIQYRPRPAEIMAIREEHYPPMAAQVELVRTAQGNRANFVSENRGRPATVVETRTVVADRDVRPPAEIHYERGERPGGPPRATPPSQHIEPVHEKPGMAYPNGHPAARPQGHPGHPEARPAEHGQHPAHPEARKGEQERHPQ